MIEVLIALAVFGIASTAIVTAVSQLYITNTKNNTRILVDSSAHDFLAIVSGNQSVLSTLNGSTFIKGQQLSSTQSSLNNWWSNLQSTNPFVQSVSVTTNPSTCSIPCQITLNITSKLPSIAVPIQSTYVLQEGF